MCESSPPTKYLCSLLQFFKPGEALHFLVKNPHKQFWDERNLIKSDKRYPSNLIITLCSYMILPSSLPHVLPLLHTESENTPRILRCSIPIVFLKYIIKEHNPPMHNFDVAITDCSSMFQLLQSNQKCKKEIILHIISGWDLGLIRVIIYI
jgi:hypothetical protein